MGWLFKLDDEQVKKENAWYEEHKKICPVRYAGAIGGRITYSFTPTSIGVVEKVECACGAKIDLTKYEDW